MADNSAELHAPYNFVGFGNKVIVRYDDVKSLPKHDVIDSNLKSGEIHYSLKAVTPVFVADGGNSPQFYRGISGKYEIPGSTIRGLIRQNTHILGMGLMRIGEDIEDYTLFYRDVGNKNSEVGEKYKALIGLKNGERIPYKVKAGYIECRGGKYYIVESENGFYRLSRKNSSISNIYPYGEVPPAEVKTVWYTLKNDWVEKLAAEQPTDRNFSKGLLFSTGKPVKGKDGKINSLYVFTEKKNEEGEQISIEDISNYRKDLEFRKKALKSNRNDRNIDFWQLPGEGEYKPVFYFREQGHTYFGMSLFLRVMYDKSIAHGLPQVHKDYNNLDDENIVLDYVYSIFGFTHGKEAYRSRVSFSNAEIVNDVKHQAEIDMVQGEPRPSFYPAYLKSVDGKPGNYLDSNFKLAGYKQYWMKQAEKPEITGKKNNEVPKMSPLPAGTQFRGVVRFKNLTEDELGLVLWAMRLEKDCYQSIGKGKPYGYGCMKLEIEGIKEYNPDELYGAGSLFGKNLKIDKENVDRYIDIYKNYASEKLAKGEKKSRRIDKLSNIMDFMFMHSIIDDKSVNSSYMTLGEYGNKRIVLKTAHDFRIEKEMEGSKEKIEAGGLDLTALAGMMQGRNKKKTK